MMSDNIIFMDICIIGYMDYCLYLCVFVCVCITNKMVSVIIIIIIIYG